MELEKESQAFVEPEFDSDINGGYAWIILVCTFTLAVCSWGNNSGFAVYFAYYSENNLYRGATAIDYAAIGGITFGVGIGTGPLINYSTRTLGTRGTLILGNICQFVSLFLTSFSSHNQIWQLYLTQGLLQSFGLAFLGMPAFIILPHWFKNTGEKENYNIRNRMLTLSQGITTAGTGVGGILFNLGMQKLLETHGIRWALRVESFISVFLASIAIAFIREKKSSIQDKNEFKAYDILILSFPPFWLIILFIVFSMFAYVVILYTLADWTISIGYSPYQGSIVAAMVSLGITIGRPIMGILADKYGALTVSATSLSISGILSLAMWIPSRNYASALTLALLMGIFSGAMFVCIASINLTVLGYRIHRLSTLFGMLWVFLGTSSIISPIIGTALQMRGPKNNQYLYCSIFVGCSFLISAIIIIILRGYMLSVRQIESEAANADLTDEQYFAIRPRWTFVVKNAFNYTTDYWL
ncbi:monocarboxylate transporter [Scheffersomyces amazonensis]|uniref:monocarboxylate transporter n=1 Tax=Scheffersomyces amazonensis TaxID=1078765 RepID=UPI00315C78DF